MPKILGISAFYHDSAAAITVDGKIVAAAQEERFTREKHDKDFPLHAIDYCLNESGLSIDELDAVVFYDKPLLKFERLLETYYAYAPKGLLSFLKAIPVWLNEKLFLKRQIYKGLKRIQKYDRKNLKLLFPEHHLSHASSAYYPSRFEDAAVLTIDGVGEWSTASISQGTGSKLKMIKEMHFPHSLGLLYSAFTYFLGFKVNSGEYKLMGLAPYGDPSSENCERYIKIIKDHLCHIKEDGSIFLPQEYYTYASGLRMVPDAKWKDLFGFERKKEEDLIEQHHCDLALAIQIVTEEIVIRMAKTAKDLTGAKNLCMAGGVALNCVANGKLLREKIFDHIYVQPAAGDAGGALGAALAVEYLYFNSERVVDHAAKKNASLGPSYSNKEALEMGKKHNAVYTEYTDQTLLARKVASLIADGNIVGWSQGRMEFGPRALGNRSILADPRDADMQRKLNMIIKQREGFRPFAPSVNWEHAQEYFDLDVEMPYMLFTAQVSESKRKELPDNFNKLGLIEKLAIDRSKINAVTHLDNSARVQTVKKEDNEPYWQLINEFYKISGCPLVVNTSFNVRGEPIVNTPFDAYRCFMATGIDYLVIGDLLFAKKEQSDWENKEKWIKEFEKD